MDLIIWHLITCLLGKNLVHKHEHLWEVLCRKDYRVRGKSNFVKEKSKEFTTSTTFVVAT